VNKGSKSEEAEDLFKQGFACSQAILMTWAGKYGIPLQTAKRIAAAFGGGMGRLRLTCGAITGAFMVIGLEYGNERPEDMTKKLQAYEKVRELAARFEKLHGSITCGDLLAKYCGNPSDIEQRRHHSIICGRLVRDAAEILEEILSDKQD
jgi:C_GCAxxG_C_C family probable redox protein